MALLPSRNNPVDSLKSSPAMSDSEANNPADSLPVMSQGWTKAKEKETGKEEGEEEEEELVVTNPKLASLIYHSFNIAFVLEVTFFFAHILIYHRTTHDWWQALLGVAIVSPLFIAPLYAMPILRDVFVRAYAMAPCDIDSSDSSKPLISEKV